MINGIANSETRHRREGIGTQPKRAAGASAQPHTQNFSEANQKVAGLAGWGVCRHPNPPGRPSAYPLYPHLGSRLPTFHDEPKPFGGPFRKGKDLRDGAHGVRHE